VLWNQQVVSRPVQRKKLIDLSYTYNDNIVVYPTAKKFSHDLVFKGKAAQGFYLESYDIATAEHAGTHMDAPSHFCDSEVKDCWRVDEIPLERLRGEGVLIDVSSFASWPDNPDFRLTDDLLRERVEHWKVTHGRPIPDGAILLIYFGWGKYWNDEQKYLGLDASSANDYKNKNVKDLAQTRRNSSGLHFPSLHPSAASWILAHRPQISMIGVDVISLDYGPSIHYPAHTILLGANIPAIENVANLDQLAAELHVNDDDALWSGTTKNPDNDNNDNNVDSTASGLVQAWPVVKAAKKVEITALPMKIGNGSGGPTRVVAVVTDEDDQLE